MMTYRSCTRSSRWAAGAIFTRIAVILFFDFHVTASSSTPPPTSAWMGLEQSNQHYQLMQEMLNLDASTGLPWVNIETGITSSSLFLLLLLYMMMIIILKSNANKLLFITAIIIIMTMITIMMILMI